MSSDAVISLRGAGKCYRLYDRPSDRLKQMVANRLPGAKRRTYYREHWALRGIDLEIDRGETVGIVGQNGSGKSTLLQLVCGTLTPSEGEIRVAGRIAPLLQLGAGFNPEFTGRENIGLNAAILGLTTQEIDARFDDIVAFAGIGDMLDQPVKLYSSGMYARLAFAVAINVDPEILIVDEALAVGDEAFQHKCFGRIQQIRNAGATVLFVSHARSTVIELCDRAVLLDAGRKLFVGMPKPAMAAYQRLIYAPETEKKRIRAEISDAYLGKGTLETIAPHVADDPVAGADTDLAAFDPSLLSEDYEQWPSRGARITSPKICTLDGRRVNVLVPGMTCLYQYVVEFDDDAFGVWFGMLIKTITGLEIAGMGSHSIGQMIEEIDAGSKYKVQFRFHVALAPGTYVLNAGCYGLVNGSEAHLHRVIDAVVFRVASAGDARRVSGYFDIWSNDVPCSVERL